MDIGLSDETGIGSADADGHLTRFTLDLAAGRVGVDRLAELPGDFPRVSPSREGRRHRYGYVATFASGTAAGGRFDSVTKVDHDSGAATTHPVRAGTGHG